MNAVDAIYRLMLDAEDEELCSALAAEFGAGGCPARSADVNSMDADCRVCAAECAAELARRCGIEADPLDRIARDALKTPCEYFGVDEDCARCEHGHGKPTCRERMTLDLLRRQREAIGAAS